MTEILRNAARRQKTLDGASFCGMMFLMKWFTFIDVFSQKQPVRMQFAEGVDVADEIRYSCDYYSCFQYDIEREKRSDSFSFTGSIEAGILNCFAHDKLFTLPSLSREGGFPFPWDICIVSIVLGMALMFGMLLLLARLSLVLG